VKKEGGWSSELIADLGNSISDFAWSHDGRMAVICCHQEGFYRVSSVNYQLSWNYLPDNLSYKNCTITTATWTPNDVYILLGTSNGHLLVIDENGDIIYRYDLDNGHILKLAYNCSKFSSRSMVSAYLHNLLNNLNTSSSSSNNIGSTSSNEIGINSKVNNNNFVLVCSFKSNGLIYLLKSYDDIDPIIIDTELEGVKFEWSSCGKILAVGGYLSKNKNKQQTNASSEAKPTVAAPKAKKSKLNLAKSIKISLNSNNNSEKQSVPSSSYINFIHFYNTQGVLLFRIQIPSIVS
jgi:hypothetical protein